MVNYQEGKVYKIVPNTDDDICYIGSTCKKYLCQRMAEHKQDYKKWKNGTHNKVTSYNLFEKYGFENCRIELLEIYPCNSRDELTKKEAGYIRALNCVNKVLPDRTGQEIQEKHKIYYCENRDTILEQRKKYQQENRDTISEQQKKYQQENRDTILEQRKIHYYENRDTILEQRKIYYDENKDKFLEKNKKYYQTNKEELNKKRNEKYTCQCGSTLRISDKSRHERSKKHIDFITSQVIV